MLRITYLPDNSNAEAVFKRLVYGLVRDGVYVQKGMPDTLFFDKRMDVVPFRSTGYVFKVEARNDNYADNPFYLNLSGVTGTFRVGEVINIGAVVATVSKVYSSSLEAINPSTPLTADDIGGSVIGVSSGATAILGAYSEGSSLLQPHTITVYPTGETTEKKVPNVTYRRHFVPEYETSYIKGVKLGKGWNTVIIQNDTTGEEYRTILNVRYFASILETYADEIWKWVNKPIADEHENIYHYRSTRLMEMYLTFLYMLPGVDVVQRLGLTQAVQGLISFPGSTFSVQALGMALSGNTPFFKTKENNTEVNPALFQLFPYQDLLAGSTVNLWFRNRQMLRWLCLLQYANNVPFLKIDSVTENQVDLVRVKPMECYRVRVRQSNPQSGKFSVNDLVSISGTSITATVVGVYRTANGTMGIDRYYQVDTLQDYYLDLADVQGTNDDLIAFISGSFFSGTITSSGGSGTIRTTPTLTYSWNFPVLNGSAQNGVLVKDLETHEFDFSDNPLNDDWQFSDSFAGVFGSMSISCLIEFALCAGFFPWNQYVTELLSGEPTEEEEAVLRITQLEIPEQPVGSSSSSSSTVFDIWTYSRHKDYPTLLRVGDALLNTYLYTGSLTKVYSDVRFNPDPPLYFLTRGTIVESPGSLNRLEYNEYGQPMLAVIVNGVFGYVRFIAANWQQATLCRYVGNGAIIVTPFGLVSLKTGELVYTSPDASAGSYETDPIDGAYINAIKLDGANGRILGIPDSDDWVQVKASEVVPDDSKVRGWATNIPGNYARQLIDVRECTGVACRILDQIIDWSTIDAPVTDIVTSYLYD